jgi:glutamyl-tRNA reductase
MEGVYLYDIDALRFVAEQSLAVRRQQIASAEAIIAEHVADFLEKVLHEVNRTSGIAGHPPVAGSSLHASQL